MKIEIHFSQRVYRSVVVEADSLQDARAKWFDADEEEGWFQDAIDGSSEYDYEVDQESAVFLFQDLNSVNV